MSNVRSIRTALVEDAEALDRLVNGLVERHKNGDLRSALLITYSKEHIPATCFANTTLADEAYAIALMQTRLINCINE